MTSRKKISCKRSKMATCISAFFIIMMSVSSSPTVLTIRNSSILSFYLRNNTNTNSTLLLNMAIVDSTTAPENDMLNQVLTGPYIILLTFSFITSTTLLGLVLAYLNNVSLAKECVLLYLYKDVLMIWISMNCLWEIRLFLWYVTVNDLNISILSAKVISFLIWCFSLALLLLINVISILKFYMMKAVMLDPPMPWGDDESLGVRKIRAACFVPSIGFTSTMYFFGLYPKLYYVFIGNGISYLALPRPTFIFPGLLVFLLITCIITSLGAKFYGSSNKQFIDIIIPREMNNFLWMMLVVLAIMLLAGGFDIFETRNRWNIFVVLISIIPLITPAFVIIKNDSLKSYVVKLIKNGLEDAFLLNIYLTPASLMLVTFFIIQLMFN